MLIHGTGDDNCHYQTLELLINELIKHNKQFSMMSYPNRTHSIREGKNTTRHLRDLMTRYILGQPATQPVPLLRKTNPRPAERIPQCRSNPAASLPATIPLASVLKRCPR